MKDDTNYITPRIFLGEIYYNPSILSLYIKKKNKSFTFHKVPVAWSSFTLSLGNALLLFQWNRLSFLLKILRWSEKCAGIHLGLLGWRLLLQKYEILNNHKCCLTSSMLKDFFKPLHYDAVCNDIPPPPRVYAQKKFMNSIRINFVV